MWLLTSIHTFFHYNSKVRMLSTHTRQDQGTSMRIAVVLTSHHLSCKGMDIIVFQDSLGCLYYTFTCLRADFIQ